MINILYCEYCNWKKNVKNIDDVDLIEVKNSDSKDKKFRCPNCGRMISCKKSKIDPQEELEYNKKRQENQEKIKIWMQEVEKYREELLKNEQNNNT
jgi:hypothetical protein